MGSNANAQICFGVDLYNDDFDTPWLEYGDIEDWWLYKCGCFVPSVTIYNDQGNYVTDITTEMKDTYHYEINKWWDDNPLPVQIVFHGYEYEMSILAVPGTTSRIEQGETIEIPQLLNQQVNPRQVHELENFAKLYLPDFKLGSPTWLLSCDYC